jgi:hypothetical protein
MQAFFSRHPFRRQRELQFGKPREQIWTAGYERVVVRCGTHRVKSLNSQASRVNATMYVRNFASAGDELVILDVERMWRVKLAQTFINPARFEDDRLNESIMGWVRIEFLKYVACIYC